MPVNDEVEIIHRMLYNESKQYRALINAVYDSDAVEGSLVADDIMAALCVRDKAKQINSVIGDERLWTIKLALSVVLRRYNISRKQRRESVAADFEVDGDGNIKEMKP